MKLTMIWPKCGWRKVPTDGITDLSDIEDWPDENRCGCQRCVRAVLDDPTNAWIHSKLLRALRVDEKVIGHVEVSERVKEIERESIKTGRGFNKLDAVQQAKLERSNK